MMTIASLSSMVLLFSSQAYADSNKEHSRVENQLVSYHKAMEALNKAVDSGNVVDVWDYISPQFKFEGCSATLNLTLLNRMLSKPSRKIQGLKVIESTAKGGGLELKLKSLAGQSYSASIDNDGNFTSFDLARFRVKQEHQAEVEAPDDHLVPLFSVGRDRAIAGKVLGVEGYFIIDTGAEYSVLNTRVFPELAAESNGALGVYGSISKVHLVALDQLQFGKINIKHPNVVALPVKDQSAKFKHLKCLGILGYRDLVHFEFIFDKKNVRIIKLDKNGNRLAKANTVKPKLQFQFKYANHMPLVACEVKGVRLRLGVDLSSASTVIDQGFKDLLNNSLTAKREITYPSINGVKEMATQAVIPSMQVEENQLRDVSVIFSNLEYLHSGVGGLKMHGFLGADFFEKASQFSINLKKKEISIW